MIARALLAAALWCAAGATHAMSSSLQFCDADARLDAHQQDRLLRFAAVVQQELDATGDPVALVSRTGTDLQRFSIRYSHAGLALKPGGIDRELPDAPTRHWQVRQLYFACSEGRPRLFDQGIAGFVFGGDEHDIGYVSIVALAPGAAAAIDRVARNDALALQLLAGRYSADAYAFSTEYQNCNQWVAELLAAAWGALGDGDGLRERAQAWLQAQGYAPDGVAVDSHLLMFLAPFVPLVHLDDHPLDDRFALHLRTSLPANLEQFVQQRGAAASHVELCHDAHRIVVRRDGPPLADGCQPEAGDRVIALD